MGDLTSKDVVVPQGLGIDELRDLAFGYWRQSERYRLDYEAVSSREAALLAADYLPRDRRCLRCGAGAEWLA